MEKLKPQTGTSIGADFEENTWTFEMEQPFVMRAGKFVIIPIEDYKPELPKVTDDVEQMADEYIKQFLPHVDTTGHWIGFQAGYTASQSAKDAEMIEFAMFAMNELDDYHIQQPMYEEPTLEQLLTIFKTRNK